MTQDSFLSITLLCEPIIQNDVECDRCGKYRITYVATDFANIPSEGRHLLSGAVRNRSEEGEILHLSKDSFKTLLDVVSPPSDPFEAIDLLLKHLLRKSAKTGEWVKLHSNKDYPLLFSKDAKEFQYCIKKALELKYIEQGAGDRGFRLDLEGWKRLSELRLFFDSWESEIGVFS